MSRPMQAFVLLAAMILAIFGWWFITVVLSDTGAEDYAEPRDNGAIEAESEPIEADDSAGGTGADAPADQSQADSSDDPAGADGPLSGDWTLWWTNSEGDTSPAFTIRFNGMNSGTVDVTNDATEEDTFFELEGDVLTMGWTRVLERTGARSDYFIGNVFDDDTIEGVWYRPGSECFNGECEDVILEFEVVLFRDELKN